MKEFFTLFALQLFNYSVCCFSYRVLAQGNMLLSVGTDVVYAAFMFRVIRKVSQGSDDWKAQAGYTLGSAAGTAIGILVSKVVTGK